MALFVAALAMALTAAPAFAGLYHPKPPVCSFGKAGTEGSESFEGVHGLAFQQQTKRLYVPNGLNEGSFGLYGFDASTLCPAAGYPPLSGFEPLATPELVSPLSGIVAVDNTSLFSQGNVYLASGRFPNSKLLGYDSAGDPLPGFPIPEPGEEDPWYAVAVDPAGHLWALDSEGIVHEFSSAGAELGGRVEIPQADRAGSPSLAFDAAGDLYYSGAGVWRFPAPGYEDPVEITPTFGKITVDRSTGNLYVASRHGVAAYGPGGVLREEFPATPPSGEGFEGIAIDETSQAVYAYHAAAGQFTGRVEVFEAALLPDLATAPLTEPGPTEVTLHGTVHPEGEALSGCRFEWVTEAAYEAAGFQSLASGGSHECEPAFGSISASGTTALGAHISGLSEGVPYRYRISAENLNGANTTKGAAPSFTLAKPAVETVGSPIRTETTARLDSRLNPHAIATTYHFQYLTEAQFKADGESFGAGTETTPSHPAGEGTLTELVSQPIEELQPATTYRYRVLADNGAFGGAATGEARTLTTRSTAEESLSHGPYPGPPESDRAWEQVNLPDTSGNPIAFAAGIAADGEAALYNVSGGTALSSVGGEYDFLFARRAPDGPDGHPSEGWRTEAVFPSRRQAPGQIWHQPQGDSDLSTLLDLNAEPNLGGVTAPAALWRLPTAGGAPQKLYESPPETSGVYRVYLVAEEDPSRVLMVLSGESLDPAHPSPGGAAQLYDLSSGTPRMVSLLPNGGVPACGLEMGQYTLEQQSSSTHWVSADGSRAFFAACGHLYMRDFGEEKTTQVDALETAPGVFGALSGPDCKGRMIRSTPEAVYFWTQSRLVPEDSAVGSCGGGEGGDVYRYRFSSGGFECLTCVAPGGLPANVQEGFDIYPEGAAFKIAVAPGGPLLYFTTDSHLLPGTPEAGTEAVYRVDTETRRLAYVAPLEAGDNVGENPDGKAEGEGTAISPSGRFLVFRSAAPALDALTDSNNNNTPQDYIYDDQERSLSCASCPQNGSPPRGPAAKGSTVAGSKPNIIPISREGDFAFATPTPLVFADQNTAPPGKPAYEGEDVYEWRDGRQLLVSDGLTEWPSEQVVPEVQAIDPSGRDLFFTEAAALTPDALDGYKRLYDARIGGGIDFPEAQKPCSLEECQGTPKGAPQEAQPGSASFSGPGNVKEEAPRPGCARGKVRRRGKCVARKHRVHHKRRNRRGAK